MLSIYLFILCIVYAIYKQLYLYAIAWVLLLSTSYLAYCVPKLNESKNVYILDRIMILIIVLFGLYYYYYYQKIQKT